MRHTLLAAAMVVTSSVQMGTALAEERIALVIGNASYQGVSKLNNPVNDATLIAKRLESVGFQVSLEVDSDFRSMAHAIRGFGRKLRAAGSDAVGLFFFAGHGVQVDGVNYMIPLNAELQNQADLEIEGVSAQTVLSQMRSAGNALNIIILDACRDNPFEGTFRSLRRGLARMNAPSGSLVAYAAAPGQVAADSSGANNSPYSKALADALITPGLTLERAFKKVRLDVEHATGGKQTPWEESSLRADFYFMAKEPDPTTPRATATLPDHRSALELTFWNSIKDSREPEAFQAYLSQFPNGTFHSLAKLKLKQLTPSTKSNDSAANAAGSVTNANSSDSQKVIASTDSGFPLASEDNSKSDMPSWLGSPPPQREFLGFRRGATFDDVVKKLGKPLYTRSKGDEIHIGYNITSANYGHLHYELNFFFKNDGAKLINEIITTKKKSPSNSLTTYLPDEILYDVFGTDFDSLSKSIDFKFARKYDYLYHSSTLGTVSIACSGSWLGANTCNTITVNWQ